MIEIRLCPECWRRLERPLHQATLNENLLLRAIAHQLSRCPRCKVQGKKLSAAARSVTLEQAVDQAWTQIEDLFR